MSMPPEFSDLMVKVSAKTLHELCEKLIEFSDAYSIYASQIKIYKNLIKKLEEKLTVLSEIERESE